MPERSRTNAPRCASQRRPLAGAHRRRRIALEKLCRAEALGPCGLEIAQGDVLAEAHEAAAQPPGVGVLQWTRSAERRDPPALLGFVERAAGPDDVARAGDPQAGALAKKVVAGHEPEREDEGVAPLPLALSPLLDHDTRVDPCRPEGLEGLAGLADEDDPTSQREAVDSHEARRSARQPDSRKIAVRKDRVALDRSGRDDDPGRMHEVQSVLTAHRDKRPLVDSDRNGALEDLYSLATAKLRREGLDALPRRAGRKLLADNSLVDDDDRLAFLGSGESRRKACDAAACHEYVRMMVADLAVATGQVERCSPSAGNSSHDALRLRPGARRPDERLVVEADGQQPPQVPQDCERIAVGRGPSVLANDPLGAGRRGHAGSHAGLAVYGQEAIRAVAGQTVEPAGTVVLERPRKDPHATPVKRRGEGIPRHRSHRASLEEKRRLLEPGAEGERRRHALPAGACGLSTRWISFVRVSRSSVSQRRQPAAWNQRSN